MSIHMSNCSKWKLNMDGNWQILRNIHRILRSKLSISLHTPGFQGWFSLAWLGFSDPPISIQIHPDPTRSIQIHSKHADSPRSPHLRPTSTQIHPDPPRSIQIHPNPHRSNQNNQDPSRSTQLHPDSTRSIQIHPDRPRSTQIHSDPPRPD